MGTEHFQTWTRTARLLHWGVALAIAGEVPAGLIMSWTYAAKDPSGKHNHILASQVHHTIGLLLIAVVLFRLLWRWRHSAPPLPAATPQWQTRLARLTQALLYGLLLLIPISGWAALSSMAAGAGYPAPSIWFFGHDGFGPGGMIPHIVKPAAWNAPILFNFGFFARIHVWALIVGGALLVLHIAAAFYHHFIRRDGVLARMVGDKLCSASTVRR
jgi:cytochrome b561